MSTIKLAIVDDHQLFRHGIQSLINKHADISIVAEADSAKSLWPILEQHKIHLVLLDISMPGASGLEVVKQAHTAYPEVKFVLLTMHAEGQYVLQAIKSGAHGYLLKNTDEDELITAIRSVALGKKYFNQEISHLMINDLSIDESTEKLTPREKEVLQLVAEGRTTKEIAEALFVSARTVETHRVNLMKKLDAHNSAALVRKATQLKLI